MNELGGELNVWREHLKLRAKWLVRIGRFRPEARRALRAVSQERAVESQRNCEHIRYKRERPRALDHRGDTPYGRRVTGCNSNRVVTDGNTHAPRTTGQAHWGTSWGNDALRAPMTVSDRTHQGMRGKRSADGEVTRSAQHDGEEPREKRRVLLRSIGTEAGPSADAPWRRRRAGATVFRRAASVCAEQISCAARRVA